MHIPQSVAEMLKTLRENGFAAYLVGGCVRDALLGLTPHDYDITTDALPEEIIALFGEKYCSYYGKAFGTVGVRHVGGFAEITTFRTEGDYKDCRHPETVAFSKDVNEDLARRDFTCNAIAYDPETGLLDPFHGADDLKNGVLRAVGVPSARFREDALRIMRGMRFYAKFGLKPDMLTAAAMHAGAFRLKAISAERVFTELCGMLMGEHITEVLLAFPDVLSMWVPELKPCIEFTQHSRFHDFTVWGHIARTVGNAAPFLDVRLTMLLHDIAKPRCYKADRRGGHFKAHAERGAVMADAILQRLRCDNHLRERVCRLVFWHRKTPDTLPEVRRVLGILGEEEFRRLVMVLDADRVSKWIGEPESRERIDYIEALLTQCLEQQLCCTVGALAVNGGDLTALGFAGKAVGEALRALLEEVICERLPNEKDTLLAWVQENG